MIHRGLPPIVLAIDQGTTSVRATVIDVSSGSLEPVASSGTDNAIYRLAGALSRLESRFRGHFFSLLGWRYHALHVVVAFLSDCDETHGQESNQ
jgi:glycerol kinase